MRQGRDILLHTCCAVCFEAVRTAIEEEGYGITAFFYNPNVHPYQEFVKRLRAVETATQMHKTPLVADKEYGLRVYLDEVEGAQEGRCRACYGLRLEATAREAARRGITAFTTTLLASPHQNHEVVAQTGSQAAARHGGEFVCRDWRDRMLHGMEEAKRRSLYRQHYCGCIWSEYERFGPKGVVTGG